MVCCCVKGRSTQTIAVNSLPFDSTLTIYIFTLTLDGGGMTTTAQRIEETTCRRYYSRTNLPAAPSFTSLPPPSRPLLLPFSLRISFYLIIDNFKVSSKTISHFSRFALTFSESVTLLLSIINCFVSFSNFHRLTVALFFFSPLTYLILPYCFFL